MARHTPFIPRRDVALVRWSENFSQKLLDGAPGEYGVSYAQAEGYRALHEAFVALYGASQAPDTRTPSGILAKDHARRRLESEARRLARVVRADGSVGEAQRCALGLSVGPRPGEGGRGTPIGRPASAPVVWVESAVGRTVRVRVRDEASPTRRGRPAGVVGAVIFTHAGEGNPPADLCDWTFQGHTTRDVCVVTLPGSVPAGARVWVTAYWLSPRLEAGPVATPAYTNVPGGTAETETGVKAAPPRRRAA